MLKNKKKKVFVYVLILFLLGSSVFLFTKKDPYEEYMIYKGSNKKVIEKNRKKRKEYVMHASQMISSIHPYAQKGDSANMIRNLVYPSLIKVEPSKEVVYQLVDEIILKENGKQVEITLKDNLKFHDGTELDSSAVKKAYEWHKEFQNNSAYRDDLLSIKKIENLNKQKLRFHFYTLPRNVLDVFEVPIMHCTEENIVYSGSGFYKITSIYPMKEIVLQKENKTNAIYDTIKILPVKYENIENHIKQQSFDQVTLSKQNVWELIEKSDAYDVYELQERTALYLGINVENPKWKTAEDRKKLLQSIDRKQIFQSIDNKKIGLYPIGFRFAYDAVSSCYDEDKAKLTKTETLLMQHGANGISRFIYQKLKNQFQKMNIILKEKEIGSNQEICQDINIDVFLIEGHLEDLLSEDMWDLFCGTINNISLIKYNKILDDWLYSQAFYIPIYMNSKWVANLHGRYPEGLF